MPNCPTCESPKPWLHPAIQFEGEVEACIDPWHEQDARWERRVGAYVREKRLRDAMKESTDAE